ncbi:MAG: hypothetical protein HUU10_15150 [Bacteroidetes bacterium]|nr:hypothetical protein [Bacteroidota bacterium]
MANKKGTQKYIVSGIDIWKDGKLLKEGSAVFLTPEEAKGLSVVAVGKADDDQGDSGSGEGGDE